MAFSSKRKVSSSKLWKLCLPVRSYKKRGTYPYFLVWIEHCLFNLSSHCWTSRLKKRLEFNSAQCIHCGRILMVPILRQNWEWLLDIPYVLTKMTSQKGSLLQESSKAQFLPSPYKQRNTFLLLKHFCLMLWLSRIKGLTSINQTDEYWNNFVFATDTPSPWLAKLDSENSW